MPFEIGSVPIRGSKKRKGQPTRRAQDIRFQSSSKNSRGVECPPTLYPKGEVGNNTWQTTTDWLCFRYWAGGSGTAPRSFSGGHGAHCFTLLSSWPVPRPPSRQCPGHKTPLRTPVEPTSALIDTYVINARRLLQGQKMDGKEKHSMVCATQWR